MNTKPEKVEKPAKPRKAAKAEKPAKATKPRKPRKTKEAAPAPAPEKPALDFNQLEAIAALALKEDAPAEQRVMLALTVCAEMPRVGAALRSLIAERVHKEDLIDKANIAISLIEKTLSETTDERNWLAEQLAATNDYCPMPDDYVCEHKAGDKCKKQGPQNMAKCWTMAAKGATA